MFLKIELEFWYDLDLEISYKVTAHFLTKSVDEFWARLDHGERIYDPNKDL